MKTNNQVLTDKKRYTCVKNINDNVHILCVYGNMIK